MIAESLHSHDADAAIYLQQMEELGVEIKLAINAIATNSLPQLQQSVARQEMICSTLSSFSRTAGMDLRGSMPVFPRCSDAAIESRIAATSEAIRQLNLQYAALLKHSTQSITLLSTLCRSFTGEFREDRGSRLKHQTWSCDM
ncbi:MAG: hypothetical protein V4555_21470 [Acidobacteriota bacterium]